MPLIFQKQRRHGPNRHGNLPSSASANFRVPSGANLSNDESSGAVASSFPRRVPATGRRVFRTAIESFSSDRTGGRLQRAGRTLARLAKDPRQLLPLFRLYYKKWHLKHLIPLIFVLIYMIVGAFIFFGLERPSEKERMVKRDAMSQYAVRRRYVDEALNHFHDQLAIRSAKELALDEGEWSLTTAMYYAGTIFTTIGYGDVVCATVAGQILTVVYAIVGIPIMLITLSHLGKFLYKWINEIVAGFTSLSDQLTRKIFPSRYAKSHNGGTTNYDSKLHASHKSAPALGDATLVGGDLKKGKTSSASAPTSSTLHHRVSFTLPTEEEEDEELTLDLDVHNDNHTAGSSSEASPPPKILIARRYDEAERLAAELKAVDVESGITNVNTTFDEDDDALLADGEEETSLPRMPVSVALTCTLSWIFLCAALFKLWETEWTYAESCYFMFISLSTIGLGDVNVKRKDLMVVCFIFVIIGLSLVSMCINVIQSALEDLYRKLLMKILLDYQAKIAEGGDAHSASMGMMKMWGSSKTAKYLMPMLSADTRRAVLQKVQEDAKETGLEIPAIFEDMDEKTGMPKILAVAAATDSSTDIERQSAIVSELVKLSDEAARPLHKSASQLSASSPTPQPSDGLPRPICYDNDTQTHRVFNDEKTVQTTVAELDDLAIQTDELELTLRVVSASAQNDCAAQTGRTSPQLSDASKETQTEALAVRPMVADAQTTTPTADEDIRGWWSRNAETMTIVAPLAEMDVQTDQVFSDDVQIQTHIFDVSECGAQTDAAAETRADCAQTAAIETADEEMQTDDIEDPAKSKNISKIRQARRRLQRALQTSGAPSTRRVSYGDRTSVGNWRDSLNSAGNIPEDEPSSEGPIGEVDEETGSSYESLNWDPIDGMHAEKQRPVSDLKRMFDRAGRRSGPTASSAASSSAQALNRTFSVTVPKKHSRQEPQRTPKK